MLGCNYCGWMAPEYQRNTRATRNVTPECFWSDHPTDLVATPLHKATALVGRLRIITGSLANRRCNIALAFRACPVSHYRAVGCVFFAGMLTVQNIDVGETLDGAEVTCPSQQLKMSETMVCNATYLITQVRLKSGSVPHGRHFGVKANV